MRPSGPMRLCVLSAAPLLSRGREQALGLAAHARSGRRPSASQATRRAVASPGGSERALLEGRQARSSSGASVRTASAGDDHIQAIAKAETVSGNAARLGRSVHLCLCKTLRQDRLAALLLLVQGEARSRPATHSPRPLMRASCGVPVVAPDRAVHRAGLTGHATTSGRQEGRSSGTTPARGSANDTAQ
jgi:hypothetical protein